jgi:hypothetical protein
LLLPSYDWDIVEGTPCTGQELLDLEKDKVGLTASLMLRGLVCRLLEWCSWVDKGRVFASDGSSLGIFIAILFDWIWDGSAFSNNA